MRIAYFDCIAGISGDMALAALADAGADFDEVRAHLVVLPFVPIDSSGDSRSQCAGLSWMVPSRLAELAKGDESITLAGSGDVSRYGITSSTEARRILGASLVVTGGMQRVGEVVRMTVDLFVATSNRHVDSRHGTYAVGRYTAMENDAVGHVIAMLGIKTPEVDRGAAQRGTADEEAYQFYAQGRGYLLDFQKTENIRIGAGLFEKAVYQEVPSKFYKIAYHRAACWHLPGSLTIEEGRSHGIALNIDGIKHPIHR